MTYTLLVRQKLKYYVYAFWSDYLEMAGYLDTDAS